MKDVSNLSNMRDAVITAAIDLEDEYKNVVFLDSDLSSCCNSALFEKAHPDKFFNVGIAEANMVGVAAGLSSMGLVPFAHSFGVFASRRAYDQFFLSGNYAKQRIILIGTDAGVTAQINGGTHMPFEDIALMRQIPDLIVLDPSDGQSCYDLTRQAYESGHSAYIRLRRKGINFRYKPGEVTLGKANILTEGKDVAIIASGDVLVGEAEKAVAMLKEKGIASTLVDLHTIKPLDEETILKVAQATGKVLVCENGRYAGGTGEAVAALLAKKCPTKMDFVNVGERFGEVGKLDYLLKAFNFTAQDIADKAEALAK